jgi:lipid-A-disaccharide synthase
MKYYIIAGEASGDLHSSNLIKELKELDNDAVFRGWGGDLMKRQGVDIVKHINEISFMGFIEVIANLRTILRNMSFCKKDILIYKPDVLILVDYPGFNLRIAEFAHNAGIKVFYYISPQVWAWKQSRVKKIKKVVDKMFVILPFEKAFYKDFDYQVDFVGHPLLDSIENFNNDKLDKDFIKNNNLDSRPLIAILPGSREQEISRMLETMLKVIPYFKEYQFIIAGTDKANSSAYEKIIKDSDVKIVYKNTYNLLKNSIAALVTSGTATLETALFDVPQVVCYKGSYISYIIAKNVIKVNYISLVNLILNESILAELIQRDFNEKRIKEELSVILTDAGLRTKILRDYTELRKKLGGSGASKKAAERMLSYLKN